MTLCFTSGDGPEPTGVECSLPFTYGGRTYEECVDIREVQPINFQPGNRSYPVAWCSTVPDYGSDAEARWGFCGSCVNSNKERIIRQSLESQKRYTDSGCLCASMWKVPGYRPCTASCCAPDGDDRTWCITKHAGCEGSGWGYCKGSPKDEVIDGNEESWFDTIEFLQISPTTLPSFAPSEGDAPTGTIPSPTTTSDVPSTVPTISEPLDKPSIMPSPTQEADITQLPTSIDSSSPVTQTSSPSDLSTKTEVPFTVPTSFDANRPTVMPSSGVFSPNNHEQNSETGTFIVVATVSLFLLFLAVAVLYLMRSKKLVFKKRKVESQPSKGKDNGKDKDSGYVGEAVGRTAYSRFGAFLWFSECSSYLSQLLSCKTAKTGTTTEEVQKDVASEERTNTDESKWPKYYENVVFAFTALRNRIPPVDFNKSNKNESEEKEINDASCSSQGNLLQRAGSWVKNMFNKEGSSRPTHQVSDSQEEEVSSTKDVQKEKNTIGPVEAEIEGCVQENDQQHLGN